MCKKYVKDTNYSYLKSGFTLIELLIAIAIVAILASIAYPSYTNSVRKSHRGDAVETLMRLSVEQEQYFAQNNSYKSYVNVLSTQGYYTISSSAGVTTDITTSYKLSATTTGTQTADTDCAVFTLDSQSNNAAKDSDGASATGCW